MGFTHGGCRVRQQAPWYDGLAITHAACLYRKVFFSSFFNLILDSLSGLLRSASKAQIQFASRISSWEKILVWSYRGDSFWSSLSNLHGSSTREFFSTTRCDWEKINCFWALNFELSLRRNLDCSLEFHRTLKIIARTLREVVNRERLYSTNALVCWGND